MKIFILEVEDAVGAERSFALHGESLFRQNTTYMYSLPFKTLEGAKEYAGGNQRRNHMSPLDWQVIEAKGCVEGDVYWLADGGWRLYAIQEHELED